MVGERDRGTSDRPVALSVHPTLRYRAAWILTRVVVRGLWDIRAEGLDRWPQPPFCLVANHHNGWDPVLVLSIAPMEPRITWFGPIEEDFSRGFKNRVMAFVGGVIPYHPAHTSISAAVRAVRRVFEAGGVLGIFAEGRIGFREAELLPLEEGAVAFASSAGVPMVPCAIVGSTYLWFRRRVVIRFGTPIPTAGVHGRVGRAELEKRVRAELAALLPRAEPRLPRRRPLVFLGDLLSGSEDLARRRTERSD
jgi:1-acyl-sn-glycerol-3-phosphate acyltransferase